MTISTLIRRATSRPAKPQKSSLRLDIQGLRAFAVLVVIADHLFKWPSGGFVGVDIFFVISGFVITQSMLREHDRNGHVSIVNFYKRRVKRIMPAAALTLIFTVAAAYIAFTASRFWTVLWDAGFSAIFVANWRFANVGTDYFAAAGPVSPLQHFWSLAVEEQFYLVWPFIVAGVFFLALKGRLNGSGARTVLAAAIGLITAASLAWSFMETATTPTTAYFSTVSRAWELGVGALLAIGAPAFSRLSSAARPVLAWTGVAGMVAALFLINGNSTFPAPWALLPVLSAALFIAAGSGASRQRYLAPFTNPASVYIGTISYSLYLWHFPIIIIAAAWLDTTSLTVQLGLLAGIFVWSYFAYELVEKRILDSSWLTGKKRKTSFRQGTAFSKAYQLKALSLLAILAIGAVYLGVRPTPAVAPQAIPSLPAASPSASPSVGAAQAASAFGPEVTKLQAELTAATQATAWPSLAPALDDVIANDPVPADVGPCGGVNPPSASQCTWGNPSAGKTAYIIGDSVAQTYIPALREIYGVDDWKLRGMSMYACRSLDLDFTQPDSGRAEACSQRKQDVIDQVNANSPDLVIVINSYYMAARIAGTVSEATPAQWKTAMGSYLAKMSGSGSKFVFITPPPADKNVAECATKQSKPSSCVGRITDTWTGIQGAEAEIAEAVGGSIVNTRDLFCVASYCPAFASALPIKRDATHMIPDYASHIVPGLRELLAKAEVGV